MIDQQQILIQALAFLIDKLGYSIKGGKELHFSNEKLQMSPQGQLQVDRDSTNTGWCVRYFHNRTIDVQAVKDDGSSGPLQLAKANDDPSA